MMKRLMGIAVGAVLLLLAAVFGPDLLDLYRLDRFVASSDQAYVAQGGPWPQLADACISCHGPGGNSRHEAYPSLAGQPARYVAAQLRGFASGQRSSPNMGPLAMTLDEPQIKLVSEHFERQPVEPGPRLQADPALQEQGRRLVTAGACAACHGEGLMGKEQFPRLVGQGQQYLLSQLEAFAAGRRTEASGVMRGIASSTSERERLAIAHYLASLPPSAR
jgi:cytochrome c553